MKKRKLLSLLTGVILSLGLMVASVSAEEIDEPVSGTPMEQAFSEGYGIMPHGEYLAYGGCGIAKMANNIVQIDGYTTCNQMCDEVYLGLFLDRYENDGSWHTIYIKELTEQNCAGISYNKNVIITPGYYYRIRAGHYAKKGNLVESNSSESPSMPFGTPTTRPS